MKKINILDKSTINQIAAGEVIERPASIIKELVENSLDAGANAISIEIKGGGIDLIRITDNGSGIDRDDIRTAFVRHSTSKIRTAEDLSYITSLGFRGEALASIAAVADVELITKQKEDFTAVRYCIGGGEEQSYEEIGAPDGTTFIIRDVFKYVPVRRKFLKTSATEGAYCNEVVERIAVSHPDVSIKYVNNGRNVLFTNGSGKMKDIIFGVYGRDIASQIVELDFIGTKNIHISGCICKPLVVRSNRNTENYFVNGRFIKSQIIYKAIEDAYQPYLMQHKYPFTSLYIEIDPAFMDVNVHPSKQEVRFENPEAVYNAVYSAITEALSEKALIHRAEKTESVDKELEKTEEIKKRYIPEPFEVKRRRDIIPETITEIRMEKSSGVETEKTSEEKVEKPSDVKVENLTGVRPEKASEGSMETSTRVEMEKDSEGRTDTVLEAGNESTSGEIKELTPQNCSEIKADYSAENTDETETAIAKEDEEDYSAQSFTQTSLFDKDDIHVETKSEFKKVFSNYRIVGQIFGTYWIIESDRSVYLIDQHAAHEKILYERFMNDIGSEKATQMVSPPMIISLSSQEEAAVAKYMQELVKYGFVLEHFGGHEYALSEIPLNLYGVDAKTMLLEIINELLDDLKGNVIKSVKEKIATCACKAAVKGNTDLSEAEAKELIKLLLKADNPFNCPHGRPIIIDVTKTEIEKKFKRIL